MISNTFCVRCQCRLIVIIRSSTHSVVGKLDAGDHHDSAISCFPIVVADETAFTSTALALRDTRHAEADVRW